MKKTDLGDVVYSENFAFRKLIDFGTFLISLFFLNIIYLYKQVSDDIDILIGYYLAFLVLFPIMLVFTVWDLVTTKVVIYEKGIYSDYSLKYRGTWHFKDVEDIYVAPFPYGGKKMRQVVLLMKNGEEKTAIAYDRHAIIDRFHEEAKKAFEIYGKENDGTTGQKED